MIGIGGQPQIRAADLLGHVGMQHRHPLDVGLVDHGAVPRRSGVLVVTPGEGRLHHDTLRQAGRAVGGIGDEVAGLQGRLHGVAGQRVAPANGAADRLGVRVEQQLGRIEAVAFLRLVRPMDSEPVQLAGTDVGKVGVPDLIGALAKPDSRRFLPVLVVMEETEVHRGGTLREDGEVGSLAVPRGTERGGRAGPDSHEDTARSNTAARAGRRTSRSNRASPVPP